MLLEIGCQNIKKKFRTLDSSQSIWSAYKHQFSVQSDYFDVCYCTVVPFIQQMNLCENKIQNDNHTADGGFKPQSIGCTGIYTHCAVPKGPSTDC